MVSIPTIPREHENHNQLGLARRITKQVLGNYLCGNRTVVHDFDSAYPRSCWDSSYNMEFSRPGCYKGFTHCHRYYSVDNIGHCHRYYSVAHIGHCHRYHNVAHIGHCRRYYSVAI